MRLSLIIEAINRASRPIDQVTQSTKKLGVGAVAASGGVGKLGNEANVARRPLARLSAMIQRTSVDTAKLNAIGYRAGRSIGTGLRFAAVGASIGIGALATFAASFSGRVIDAGKKYDKAFASKVTSVTDRLAKQWQGFLVKVGRAGVFDLIVAKLSAVSAWVDRMAANGSLDRWAKKIAAAMTTVGNKLSAVNWLSVARDVLAIGKAMFSLGRFIANIGGGGLSGLFNVAIVGLIGKVSFGLYGLASALGVVSIAGAPLWLVVGGIAAIAAGAFLVWRNWDAISAKLSGLWEGLKTSVAGAVAGIVGFFQGMWPAIRATFASGVSMIWNALPAWFRGVLSGTSFIVRTIMGSPAAQSGQPTRPLQLGNPVAPPSRLRLGPSVAPPTPRRSGRDRPGGDATVRLHVTSDRGTTVAPTKIKATGLAMEVNTGRAMRSVA